MEVLNRPQESKVILSSFILVDEARPATSTKVYQLAAAILKMSSHGWTLMATFSQTSQLGAASQMAMNYIIHATDKWICSQPVICSLLMVSTNLPRQHTFVSTNNVAPMGCHLRRWWPI